MEIFLFKTIFNVRFIKIRYVATVKSRKLRKTKLQCICNGYQAKKFV